MIIKNVNLETVCGITSTFPENEHDEIAFAGKSNVGKSSLINALMNRKALARTSSQPGKTQTINFYNVNDAMYLVDLPGYGYANANIEIKAQWGKMIERYLHTSTKLKAVFLLIDIRHEPSDNDCLMYDWMVEQGFAPIIIATKMDKLSRGAVAKHVQMIRKTLQVMPDTIVIPFSAETKQGREEIWELMDSMVLPDLDEELAESLRSKSKKIGTQRDSRGTARPSSASEAGSEGFKNGTAQNTHGGSSVTDSDAHAASEPQRKQRWKAAGKETAKKTKKLQEKKAAKQSKNAPKPKSATNSKTAKTTTVKKK